MFIFNFVNIKKQQNVTIERHLKKVGTEAKKKTEKVTITLFWKVPHLAVYLVTVRLSRLHIKGASTKGLVFASKDGSWFTTVRVGLIKV